MFWSSIASTIIYFTSALVNDAIDFYHFGKKRVLLTPNLFTKINEGIKIYKSSFLSSFYNFSILCGIGAVYPSFHPFLSLQLELARLIICGLVSSLFYTVWKKIYPIENNQYRIQIAACSPVKFLSFSALLQLPFLFFPVRESLQVGYLSLIVFFIVRNNIFYNNKHDEKRLPPIFSKRPSYTFSKSNPVGS